MREEEISGTTNIVLSNGFKWWFLEIRDPKVTMGFNTKMVKLWMT